jgi:hypothetical protein
VWDADGGVVLWVSEMTKKIGKGPLKRRCLPDKVE